MNSKQKLKLAVSNKDLQALSREIHMLTQVLGYSEENLNKLFIRDCNLTQEQTNDLLAQVRQWEMFGDE